MEYTEAFVICNFKKLKIGYGLLNIYKKNNWHRLGYGSLIVWISTLIHYIYIRMVYKHNNTIYVQNTAKDYQVHV